MSNRQVPVITIDGPSGSGKGTICQLLARELGWELLDSGALYRLVGLAARHHGVELDNEEALVVLAAHLDVQFVARTDNSVQIILEGEEVTDAIRTEVVGKDASIVAAIPAVRDALLERQRAFAEPPGLIADGRDMGTVVFPEAPLKIYLDASAEVRAERRFKQLHTMGVGVKLPDLVRELKNRDKRDQERAVSPLKPAAGGIIIDTSECSRDVIFDQVLALAVNKGLLA